MVGIRRMILDADSFRGFFDILPHAFRDAELRARLFSLYVWWYHQNLAWLGLGTPNAESSEMLMGLAELIAAIPDGLSVQAGLNPDVRAQPAAGDARVPAAQLDGPAPGDGGARRVEPPARRRQGPGGPARPRCCLIPEARRDAA